MKLLALLLSHIIALVLGFGLGVYALPIIIAPEAPSVAEVQAQAATAKYTGQFRRDLKDSDFKDLFRSIAAGEPAQTPQGCALTGS